MAKKKRALYARAGRSKKAGNRGSQRRSLSPSGDHSRVRPARSFDEVAQASIEKNREVLRELAKH